MPLFMVDKYGLRTSMIIFENKDKLKINGLKRGHFYNKNASRLPNNRVLKKMIRDTDNGLFELLLGNDFIS